MPVNKFFAYECGGHARLVRSIPRCKQSPCVLTTLFLILFFHVEEPMRLKRRGKMRMRWLRWTEEKNALDYLEKAYWFIQQTDKNIVAWKWVAICLSSALYSFAICALKGTNPRRVIHENNQGKENLISFPEALKHCQDRDWMAGSRPLVLTVSQQDSIKLLRGQLRNVFEHYIPTSWSLEIHGMPHIAMDILDIIRFLAIDTHTYTRFSEYQKRRIRSIVYQGKLMLRRSKLYQ